MYQTVMYEVVRRQQNRLQFIHVFHNMQHMTICVTSYGALGHVPLDFQLLNFSGDFRAAQALKLDSMWLPSQKKSIHAYSFVTVYCVNFIFLCVTLIYFLLVLCPPRTKSWRLHCILPTTEKIIPRVKFAENKKKYQQHALIHGQGSLQNVSLSSVSHDQSSIQCIHPVLKLTLRSMNFSVK